MANPGPLASTTGSRRVAAGDSLADVLDRVLDKGVVIAGDIAIALVGIELLTIKIRLLVASADKAREMGIDWWSHDPFLTGAKPRDDSDENQQLTERIARLEKQLANEKRPSGSRRETTARTSAP